MLISREGRFGIDHPNFYKDRLNLVSSSRQLPGWHMMLQASMEERVLEHDVSPMRCAAGFHVAKARKFLIRDRHLGTSAHFSVALERVSL